MRQVSKDGGIPPAAPAGEDPATVDAARTVLLMRCAGRRLALAARDVREVVRAGICVRVPEAPGAVLGLLAVRGEMVTVVDLARALQWPRAAGGGPGSVAVLREAPPGSPETGRARAGRSSELLGLRVDVVEDLAEVEGEAGPPAAPFDGPAFRGVVSVGGDPVPAGLLDTARLAADLGEAAGTATPGAAGTGGSG